MVKSQLEKINGFRSRCHFVRNPDSDLMNFCFLSWLITKSIIVIRVDIFGISVVALLFLPLLLYLSPPPPVLRLASFHAGDFCPRVVRWLLCNFNISSFTILFSGKKMTWSRATPTRFTRKIYPPPPYVNRKPFVSPLLLLVIPDPQPPITRNYIARKPKLRSNYVCIEWISK